MTIEDITLWHAMFPENKQVSTDGYNKGQVKDCVNKMQKFCKDNKNFTKEVIFAATKMYLAVRKADGYSYTKRPYYFIAKLGQPSMLGEYCERIMQGEQEQKAYELKNNIYEPTGDFI